MIIEKLSEYNIILASKSPRRHMLLRELGLSFEIKIKDTPEDFSPLLKAEEIPLYLAEIKSMAFVDELSDSDLLITADTIVWINNRALNKPETLYEARAMLSELSRNKHEVYTGVCIRTYDKVKVFYDKTSVYFKELSKSEIDYYVDQYKPLDKAGAYGIQEWIGYIGIERFDGCYYNVMGLPVRKVYDVLKNYF